MDSKRAFLWLFIMVWTIGGAVPSSALCSCGHNSDEDPASCCAPKADPAPLCCCSNHADEHPGTPSNNDAPGSTAVTPAGCPGNPAIHTPYTVVAKDGLPLEPGLRLEAGILSDPETALGIPASISGIGPPRLLTSVYRL